MEIAGTIIFAITLIITAFLNAETAAEQFGKFVLLGILLLLITGLVYDISYNSGVKDGACNQLRGKYEVTYVIDKDSCVVDTIINVK